MLAFIWSKWKFHNFSYILWLSHALDLVLLVVTNRSMRDVNLELRFGPHIDTNYCACENKYLNICLCFACMRHILMLKFDDIMSLIRSCCWLQIGPWEPLVSSHDSAPHRYKLLCAWKFHQVFKCKSMSLLYASYIHVQIKLCHALDLVLLVITNRSIRGVCLESRFDPT
jgi:hypothetical protein